MNKYVLPLDLKENSDLIKEYEEQHKQVWPEILKSISDSGILKMEIFRFHNRLCMIMETTDDFSFEKKNEMDKANQKVQEWENLMWKFQQEIPGAKANEKWVLMNAIFEFNN